MFKYNPELPLTITTADAPQIVVLVDTEEEFSWDSFSPEATGVANIAQQHHAHKLLNSFGIVPTYLVDHPVATKPEGIGPLKEMLASGTCRIGAQLHGWVNPPIEETITHKNTFQGNLPPTLERAKIAHLTRAIEDNFGIKPAVFKAGRNGFGRNTTAALIENGYTIDNSVLPYTDLAPDGPDFTGSPTTPFWLDADRRLLEMPMTVGLVGLIRGARHKTTQMLLSRRSNQFKVPGILARTGLLERIRLTPEGISLAEAQRLTQTLMRQGQRLFVLCYHSSTLLPGSTPYVRTVADRERFLAWLQEYMEFFFGALNGRASTPEDVLAAAQKARTGG